MVTKSSDSTGGKKVSVKPLNSSTSPTPNSQLLYHLALVGAGSCSFKSHSSVQNFITCGGNPPVSIPEFIVTSNSIRRNRVSTLSLACLNAVNSAPLVPSAPGPPADCGILEDRKRLLPYPPSIIVPTGAVAPERVGAPMKRIVGPSPRKIVV